MQVENRLRSLGWIRCGLMVKWWHQLCRQLVDSASSQEFNKFVKSVRLHTNFFHNQHQWPTPVELLPGVLVHLAQDGTSVARPQSCLASLGTAAMIRMSRLIVRCSGEMEASGCLWLCELIALFQKNTCNSCWFPWKWVICYEREPCQRGAASSPECPKILGTVMI